MIEKGNEQNNMFSYTEKGDIQNIVEKEKPQDFEEKPEGVWSLQGIWNDVASLERRKPKVRDYVSFGDIGKTDMWSRYQKMMGVPETNEIELRVLRIFQAGNEFHEMMEKLLKRVGLLINSQDYNDEKGEEQWSVIPESEKELKQFGAYDALVGGKIDREKVIREIKEDKDLSDFSKQKALRIVEFFTKKFIDKYSNGLEPMIYEFKSINSQAFWGKKDYLYQAYPHHKHQLFGYMKANNIKEGRLLYISKDDLTLAEFPVYLNDEKLAESYRKDIETISYYVKNKIEPPKSPYVIFNPRKLYTFQDKKIKYKIRGSYVFNWEVSWSSYLTLMTGFKTSNEFELSVKGEISEKNKQIKEKILKKVALSINK